MPTKEGIMTAGSFEHLVYEKREHRVTLILNRPEKINALNERLTREFELAMLQAEDDDDVRVVVIQGAGRGFALATITARRTSSRASGKRDTTPNGTGSTSRSACGPTCAYGRSPNP
jgi:1,4-dihydroxy-2-naphthoyl-CoA synthase